MIRLRFSMRTILGTVLLAAIASATVTGWIRRLNRITGDVQVLREYRANVDVTPVSWKFDSLLAPKFSGYPTDVRKYFDTPDLEDVDTFIEIIARNPTIKKLTIDGSSLDDIHVQRILGLPLETLCISQCPTGDTLNAQASASIRRLDFYRTRLNDRSLTSLGRLPSVQHLDLTRTRVTDDSIDFLSKLPSLRTLGISRCKITNAGRLQLVSLRPDIKVHWEPLRN